MSLRKKIKNHRYNKDLIGSFQTDLNSLRKEGLQAQGKVKKGLDFFGLPSNIMDQRITDGLNDLLGGVVGVRSSNIPDITGAVELIKQKNRVARLASQNASNARASKVPGIRRVIQFPEQYFNERGKGDSDSIEANNKAGDEVRKTSAALLARPRISVTQAFPNSIHFRSLPRRAQDHSEQPNEVIDAMSSEAPLPDITGGLVAKGLNALAGTEAAAKAQAVLDQDAGAHGSVDPSKEEIFDIFLYLPQQLADTVKVSYAEGEVGIIEKVFARLFAFGEEDDAVKDIQGDQNFDMNEILRQFRGMMPGGNIIQSATGNMTNPMKFQTLENVAFRTYSYKFTLKPTTSKEAVDIKKIIYAFKHSMLPGVAGENNKLWTFPNEWAIKFQGPIKGWVDFPLTCVCTGCDIDYAGGGAVTLMEDGAPASIDMTVEFTETVQMSRQRYHNEVSPKSRAGTGAADKGTIINTNPVTGGKGHS